MPTGILSDRLRLRLRRAGLITPLLGLAMAPLAASAQFLIRREVPATCLPSSDDGGITVAAAGGGCLTFTQADVETTCVSVPGGPLDDPCPFCLVWQLVEVLGPNIDMVVAGYPTPVGIVTACNDTDVNSYTNTSPPLLAGRYQIQTYLRDGACDDPAPEVTYQATTFGIR